WKDVDVTRLVDGSGVLAVALATNDGRRIVLASREAGRRAPRLIVRSPAGTTNVAPSASGPSDAAPGDQPSGATPAGAPGAAPAGSPGSLPVDLPGPVPPPTPPPAVTPPPVPAPQPSSAQPCGVTSMAPAWKHVVWIVMENHST